MVCPEISAIYWPCVHLSHHPQTSNLIVEIEYDQYQHHHLNISLNPFGVKCIHATQPDLCQFLYFCFIWYNSFFFFFFFMYVWCSGNTDIWQFPENSDRYYPRTLVCWKSFLFLQLWLSISMYLTLFSTNTASFVVYCLFSST